MEGHLAIIMTLLACFGRERTSLIIRRWVLFQSTQRSNADVEATKDNSDIGPQSSNLQMKVV